MNTEVNYEIAKLLAEKGFPQNNIDYGIISSIGKNDNNDLIFGETYACPNISQVVMWLYEKNSIWVAVGLVDNSRTFHFKYSITISNDREYHDEDCFDMAKTIYSDSKEKFGEPTEAYLSAITHILNNLI